MSYIVVSLLAIIEIDSPLFDSGTEATVLPGWN